MDFPVETVVTLEGSTSSGSVMTVSSSASASSSTAAAAPTVVSEVVLPSAPTVPDAKSSPAPLNQLPPSLQPSGPLSPADEPVVAEGSPTPATAEAEAQDASRPVSMSSSPPTNDVTSELRLTESETSIQPRDGLEDDTTASVPVTELS